MDQHVIEHIDPAKLTPHPDNSMKHGDAQITALVASFEQFGFNGVIVIDENDIVLAGHGRRLAAIRANMATVPCLRRTGLTDAQKRAYIIADNKIGRESEWDVEVLEKQLQELSGAGLDLDSLGISAEALASITAPQGKKSSSGRKSAGERAKPLPVKLDADKLRRMASELGGEIRDGGKVQTSAVIGLIDGVTYQLVATGTAESEKQGLGRPEGLAECLTKPGRRTNKSS